MSEILEGLETAPIHGARWSFNPTVENHLYIEYEWRLKDSLGGMMVQPDFNATDVPGVFARTIDEVTPDIVLAAIHTEKGRIFEDSKALTNRIGKEAIDAGAALTIRPEQAFVDDLHSQVAAIPYDFSGLERLHDMLPVQYLTAARLVHELDHKVDGWADTAYGHVQELVDNQSDIALDSAQRSALYAVCYLPHEARSLTRRSLINATIVKALGEKLGPDITKDEQEALDTFSTAMKADVLTGQQWSDLPIGETTAKQMAFAAAARVDALCTVNAKIRDGSAARLGDAWLDVTKDMNSFVDTASHDAPYDEWASQDTGHCFQAFKPWDLLKVFEKGMHKEERAKLSPEKDGTYAVILEDDQEQMRVWRQMVIDHARQDVAPETCLERPDAVAQFASDPNASLFLIDIQNGNDLNAGIRVGEQLLEERLKILDQYPDAITTVEIWSTSKDSVQQACDFFKPILNAVSQKNGFSYMINGGGGSSGRARLTFNVRLKGWGLDIGR